MGSDQLARGDAEEAEEALLNYGQAAIGELESGPDPTAHLGLRSVILGWFTEFVEQFGQTGRGAGADAARGEPDRQRQAAAQPGDCSDRPGVVVRYAVGYPNEKRSGILLGQNRQCQRPGGAPARMMSPGRHDDQAAAFRRQQRPDLLRAGNVIEDQYGTTAG